MEQRLANTFQMTVNEKNFIQSALLADLRTDGRRPFDYRELTIKFGREDGSSEVQLGQTHVMGFVTAQLGQPYRDRPNEGSLSIFTEFSPMADPAFEPGRPGESAIELGRVVDRGLRESRAIDTESLCVVSGKFAWSIRIDLHILDNGGNLVDAANIAALSALLTFRRPECSLGGEDGQEVIVHPPEVKDPLPLIIHHLPIAVTFGILSEEGMLVIDPTHLEEGVMGGRLTATLTANGDICSIQKAGGNGVLQSVIMQCLRIASVKAADVTAKIKKAVDSYTTARALRKIKRQPSTVAVFVDEPIQNEVCEVPREEKEKSLLKLEDCSSSQSDNVETEPQLSEHGGVNRKHCNLKSSVGGPSSWDSYSKGVDSDKLPVSLASQGDGMPNTEVDKSCNDGETAAAMPSVEEAAGEKTLKDAVKPKNKRRKKASSKNDANSMC